MDVGQRRETFPDRDARGEIQDISKNRVTLWARRIWKIGFLPFPGENEDRDAKHQRIEHRRVEHNDKGEFRVAVQGFMYHGRYVMLPTIGRRHEVFVYASPEIVGLPT